MKKIILFIQLFNLQTRLRNFILITWISIVVHPFTANAQVDTISQYEKQGYGKLLNGPVGSPGQDYELILTKSSANFAKQSAAQPGKYHKVVFYLVDSIPDEIRFQENLEEIYIFPGEEPQKHNILNAKPHYISKEVLKLPHLKSVYVHASISLDVAVNLLNPNLEKLSLKMFKRYDSKTDPVTLQFPENLNWLSTNMISELETPLLRCKKLKSLELYPFGSKFPPVVTKLTSLNSLSLHLEAYEDTAIIPDLTPLTKLENLSLSVDVFTEAIDLSPIYGMNIKHLRIYNTRSAFMKEVCNLPHLESLHIDSYYFDPWSPLPPECRQPTLRKLHFEGDLSDPWGWMDIDWKQLRYLAMVPTYWMFDSLDVYNRKKVSSPYPSYFPATFTLSPDADTLALIGVELSTARLLPASPGLRHILLANNNLQALPPACSAWVHLRYLNLSHNQLDDLPDGLQALQSLDTLNLNANRFTRFPRVLLRGLSPLFVSLTNNELRSIPKDIDLLAHTEVLDLRGNQIARIPTATLRAIQRMPRLKELRLADNPIRQEDIPVELREKLVF